MSSTPESQSWYWWDFAARNYPSFVGTMSWCFVMMGLVMIGPWVALIVFDCLLWSWRLVFSRQPRNLQPKSGLETSTVVNNTANSTSVSTPNSNKPSRRL